MLKVLNPKVVYVALLACALPLPAIAGEWAEFSTQEAGDSFIDLQHMCRNQGKYSPYVYYSTAVSNQVYFGFFLGFFDGLDAYLNLANSTDALQYRLTYNNNLHAFSPYTRFYLGIQGEYFGYTDQVAKHYRSNIGVHAGIETDFYQKILILFAEAGPAMQLRTMTIQGVSDTGHASDGGMGYYLNAGVRYSYYISDVTSVALRLGWSIESGKKMPITIVKSGGRTDEKDINGMVNGPFLDLGITF